MKKFGVVMVLVMLTSMLFGCTPKDSQEVSDVEIPVEEVKNVPTMESQNVCDVIIPVEGLRDYSGKDVMIEGTYNGLTILEIEGKHVCASSNGLYVEDRSDINIEVLFKREAPNGVIGSSNDFLGYSYGSMYAGMTGKLFYLLGPEILIDKTLTLSQNYDCTMLDENSIESLDGKLIKIIGSHELEDGFFNDETMVFTVDDQPYCYANRLNVYKTLNVFGKPHHVMFDADPFMGRIELLYGDEGILSVEDTQNEYPTVYIDIGEGEREISIDPMVEEISSHNSYLRYLEYEGRLGETLADGKGSIYSLMMTDDAPVLNPGYLISPTSYTYGGKVDLNSEIGKIFNQSLILSSVSECEYDEYDKAYEGTFTFTLGGKQVAVSYLNQTYITLIKGNGANQILYYYLLDATDFCQNQVQPMTGSVS